MSWCTRRRSSRRSLTSLTRRLQKCPATKLASLARPPRLSPPAFDDLRLSTFALHHHHLLVRTCASRASAAADVIDRCHYCGGDCGVEARRGRVPPRGPTGRPLEQQLSGPPPFRLPNCLSSPSSYLTFDCLTFPEKCICCVLCVRLRPPIRNPPFVKDTSPYSPLPLL